MKPRLRDYLSILTALLVIFICGYGIGQMLGRKQERARLQTVTLPAPAPHDKHTKKWGDTMMSRLDDLLELDEDQEKQILQEIELASREIRESRRNAMQDYYRHLLTLCDRLPNHLTPEQTRKIEGLRATLRQTVELGEQEKSGL